MAGLFSTLSPILSYFSAAATEHFQSARLSRTKQLIGTLICSITLFNPLAQAHTNDLPDFGDRSAVIFTPQQERAIGLSFKRQLYQSRNLITDPEIKDYLIQLTQRILDDNNLSDLKITSNILKDSTINAFAVPGGYITFNSGLILESDNESELAAVLSHEIAHITQKHMPRMIAKMDAQRLPAMAAMVGAILIGGDVATAGVNMTGAQLISNQLRYSRGYESEADAIGIRYLVNAGFNPDGMSAFFGKLERNSRMQKAQMLEFLSTHPLSFNRIAESEARAEDYDYTPRPDNEAFYYFKYKIGALRENAIAIYKGELELETDEQLRLYSLYGLTHALLNDENTEEAEIYLAQTIAQYRKVSGTNDEAPLPLALAITRASLSFHKEEYDQTLAALDSLIAEYPEKTYLNRYLVQTLLRAERAEEAKKKARFVLRRDPDALYYYLLLRDANRQLNLFTQAAQAEAEFYAQIGNFKQALEILTNAEKRLNADDEYLKASLASRITVLEQEQQLMRSLLR